MSHGAPTCETMPHVRNMSDLRRPEVEEGLLLIEEEDLLPSAFSPLERRRSSSSRRKDLPLQEEEDL